MLFDSAADIIIMFSELTLTAGDSSTLQEAAGDSSTLQEAAGAARYQLTLCPACVVVVNDNVLAAS